MRAIKSNIKAPYLQSYKLITNLVYTWYYSHTFPHLQALINAESSQYIDSKGKTVMHQAAEQVS